MKKLVPMILGFVAIIATFIATASVSLASPPFTAYQPKAPESLTKVH